MPKKEYTFPFRMEHLADAMDKLKEYFQNKSIGDRLREVLFGKMFVIVNDDEDKCKRVFRNQADADRWFQAKADKVMTPEIAALEFSGNTIPGSEQYQLAVTVKTDTFLAAYGTKNCIFRFFFSTVDRINDVPTEESVDVYFTFESTKGKKTVSKRFQYKKEDTEFNITDWLEAGENIVTITVTGTTSGLTRTERATFTLVDIKLTSSFNIAIPRQQGQSFGIPFTLAAPGEKTIEFYIDSSVTINDSVPDGGTAITYNFQNTLTPGLHTLQMKGYTMVNGVQFQSEMLFFEFVVAGDGLDLTATFISAVFPSGTPYFMHRNPGLIGEQYVPYQLNWAYYSTSDPSAVVIWKTKLNGVETVVGSREVDEKEGVVGAMPDPVEFQPDQVGTYDLYAFIKDHELDADGNPNYIGQYTISVSANSAGLAEAPGAILKLSALGRSNDEPVETRSDWSSNGYTTTFNNKMTFDGLAGYTGKAVRLDNGATAVNTCKPFAEENGIIQTGGALVFHFRTFNVEDENAPLIEIGDPSLPSTAYFAVYGKRVILRPSNGDPLTYQFASEEDTHMAVVVMPKTGVTDQQMMFFIFNGIEAPGSQYGNTAVFNIGKYADRTNRLGMIKMGCASGKAAIDIYNVRVYPNMLSMWQGMNNFMIDKGGDVASMMRKNNIFEGGDFNKVNIDLIRDNYRVLEVIGPLGLLETSQKKENFFGSVRYSDPINPKFNLERLDGGAYIETAGQSRLTDLMAKSFHLDLNKNDNVATYQNGKLCHKNRFIFADGNIPENGVRIDICGADSSICRNASHMRLVNKFYPYIQVDGKYPLRTPAQDYALSGKWSEDMAKTWGKGVKTASDYPWPHNINIAPDCVPIVVVWHETENDPMQVYGLGTMTEEKKAAYANGNHSIYIKEPLSDGTLDPYDRYSGKSGIRGWDNEGVIEMEFVNPTDLTYFKDDSSFNDKTLRDFSFELCFPKSKDLSKDDVTDNVPDGTHEAAVWKEFLDTFIHPLVATYHNQELFAQRINDIIYMPSFAMYYNKVMDRKMNDSLCRNLHVIRYNMGTASAPKWQWWAKWWDADVSVGLFQSNAMGVDPSTDRNTIVGGKYVMAGRDENGSMWLWDGLEQMQEFKDMCKKYADASFKAGWSVDADLAMQDEITNSFSEALYNLDGTLKFLNAWRKGNDYMIRMLGDNKPYRHGFMKETTNIREAQMAIGQYASRAATFSVTGAAYPMKAVLQASSRQWFGLGATSTNIVTGLEKTPEDGLFEMQLREGMTFGRDFLYVYGADKVRYLDMSDFTRLMERAINLGVLTQVQSLYVGYPSHAKLHEQGFNRDTSVSFTGLGNLTRLMVFSIMGFHEMTKIDIHELNHLTTFLASGSGLTTFAPANGTKFNKVELPDTIKSIECTRVQLGDLTFWRSNLEDNSVSLMTSCPTSLLALTLSGMGEDAGAHSLVHQWLQMLHENPGLIQTASITYRAIDWTGVSKQDILTLARIPRANRNISGYIKCSEEYTTEDMQTLLTAFEGIDIFSPTGTMIFDCEASGVLIAASGEGVSTMVEDGEAVIEILQGCNAKFESVGFPIRTDNSSSVSYRWNIRVDGVLQDNSGDDISFRDNVFDLSTHILHTNECADPTFDYAVYVQKFVGMQMVSGEVKIRVVARSYPTAVDVNYRGSQAVSYDPSTGTMQITDMGTYRFNAEFTPTGFNGRLKEVNGGTWQIDGVETTYAEASSSTNTSLSLRVKRLPDEDTLVTLHYDSQWRNGLELSNEFQLLLISIIEAVLTLDEQTGNPVLYEAVSKIVAPQSVGYPYSSLQLKAVEGEFNIGKLVADPTAFKNFECTGFDGKHRNLLPMFKNVTILDLSGTGVDGTVDISKNTNIVAYNSENTNASIIC